MRLNNSRFYSVVVKFDVARALTTNELLISTVASRLVKMPTLRVVQATVDLIPIKINHK